MIRRWKNEKKNEKKNKKEAKNISFPYNLFSDLIMSS